MAATRLALEAYLHWFPNGEPALSDQQSEPPLSWTTPNVIALQLASMRLRDFSRRATGQPLLICAPFSLHNALIADFAPGHSLVEALQRAGLDRIYVTDWCSATPEIRYLSIDSYLADLNVAVDEIGTPVDLIGLCQGGWLSLVYAARFPHKVRRLVLAGAPVDVSVPSDLSRMVAGVPEPAFDELVQQGKGIVSGKHTLRFWSMPLTLHDIEATLQRNVGDGSEQGTALVARFERWDRKVLDLPGTFYLEATNWIFRENRIADGRFIALGRRIDLAEVKVPAFLLAGERDNVVPLDQALATARLLGTPPQWLEQASEPCGHLGLFMGRESLGRSWRRIVRWLQAGGEDVAALRPKIRA
ncbi:alpha/beta fold hydrolase [Bradyrhizobium cenepequi]|uniref:alpha/beta fold hydrolase n=1 Tax=Bradyrhizobium cenepequi TaxID=2821403 RepID=UPI001CE2B368|nr:alpha/beta fold hydrolase [Bradyrhizobium cenepequi]MCA6105690.1 alpha/beta fold hydrolase [Bradyrhizobium cenepequi]